MKLQDQPTDDFRGLISLFEGASIENLGTKCDLACMSDWEWAVVKSRDGPDHHSQLQVPSLEA